MNLAILDRSLTAASEEAILDSMDIIQSMGVEVAAVRDFLNLRNGETAAAMLAAVLVEPESWQATHLACVAAAHLASSDHPMAVEMAKVPPLDKSDEGMTVPAIIQVWDTWMALHADINCSAYRM